MTVDRPAFAFPPIRVYIDAPDDEGSLQLMPVRGVDMLEPSDHNPDVLARMRVFHCFGPPGDAAPGEGWTVRVEPHDEDVRILIRTFTDVFGIRRFTPMCPVPQTSN